MTIIDTFVKCVCHSICVFIALPCFISISMHYRKCIILLHPFYWWLPARTVFHHNRHYNCQEVTQRCSEKESFFLYVWQIFPWCLITNQALNCVSQGIARGKKCVYKISIVQRKSSHSGLCITHHTSKWIDSWDRVNIRDETLLWPIVMAMQ